MTKRLFDIACSLVGLFLLMPLFMYITLKIRAESPGPIFYRGLRVGQGGTRFRIFKFRSMVMNAETIGGPSTPDDDPRITQFGKFLRKRKLDELPQLLNVIAGDMSLVGPRPEVPVYVDLFTEAEKAILSVRPGMTDWASIWNSDEGAVLAGEADPEKAYMEKIRPNKIRLQLEYVNKANVFTDVKIIFQTLATLLKSGRRPLE
jgi:lipopolysaccharide/colanic/teichoic acid biosynthesis glycosyltransferase